MFLPFLRHHILWCRRMSGPKDCPSDSLLPHLEGAALSSRAVVWRLPLDHATRSEATNHFSYNIVKDPMNIRDLNATILRLSLDLRSIARCPLDCRALRFVKT